MQNLIFVLAALTFGSSSVWAKETECETFIKTLPTTSIHGWVDVPQNWYNPTGKKIKVFYYGYHIKENPNVPVLAYFNGGPGADAHGMDSYLAAKPDYAKVPFLFIDQRGTGCSNPLPQMEFSRRGVQETGLYGGRSIVYDSEAIRRQVFKGKKWRIFGQSYGSFIVHRYLELAPQAILAAYAHGFAAMTDSILWTEMRAHAFKRVGDEYFKIYPGDREIIRKSQHAFPSDYCYKNPEFKVCGSALLDDLGWSSLSFKDFGAWERLHKNIGGLLLQSGQINMEFVRKNWPENNPSDPGTLLVDVAPGREGPGGFCNTWSCEKAVPRMIAHGDNPLEYEFSECRNALAIQRTFDYRLVKEVVAQDYISLPRIIANLRALPNLKFFLYSGRLDTFGPEETYQQEARLLGSRLTYRAYASGHGAYFEEAQTWKDILSTQNL